MRDGARLVEGVLLIPGHGIVGVHRRPTGDGRAGEDFEDGVDVIEGAQLIGFRQLSRIQSFGITKRELFLQHRRINPHAAIEAHAAHRRGGC